MYLAILLSLLSFAAFGADKFISSYTSLDEKDCKILESSENDPEAEIDYFRSICPGKDKLSVYVVGGDARSWLVIKKGTVEIDLYSELLSAASELGSFPNVVGTKLEWRYKNTKLNALIVRMSGFDEESNTSKSALVVLKVEGLSIKAIGLAKTNEEARQIADSN